MFLLEEGREEKDEIIKVFLLVWADSLSRGTDNWRSVTIDQKANDIWSGGSFRFLYKVWVEWSRYWRSIIDPTGSQNGLTQAKGFENRRYHNACT